MWLEKFARSREEIFQFEVIGFSQSEAEPFRVPPFPPQDVFTETSRSGADISKIQEFIGPNYWNLQMKEQHK
jgi:hypothetical protein